MSFTQRDVAMSWGGRSVQDAAGVDMGVCIKAFADDATGPATWLVVELPGGSQMAVPMAGTTEVSGIVRVAFLLETVITAPTPAVLDRLSPDDAARLYDHYGLTQPAAASPTLPAAADVPTPSRPPSVPPPAAKTTAPPLGTGGEAASASGGWGAPDVTDEEPWAAPAASRLVPVVLAGAASMGAVVAAVLSARRLWGGRRARRRNSAARPWSSAGRPRRPGVRSRRTPTATGVLQRSARHAAPAVTVMAGTASRAGRVGARAASRTGRAGLHGAAVSTGLGVMAVQQAARPARRFGQVAVDRAGRVRRPTALDVGRIRSNTSAAVIDPVTDRIDRIRRTGRTIMGIIKSAVIFGGGYVVGSRAGRQRYEELKQKASQLLQRPEVKQAGQRAKDAINQKKPGAGREQQPGQRWSRARRRKGTDDGGFGRTESRPSAAAGTTSDDARIDLTAGTQATTQPRLP